jgi:hypothetical protein
MPPDRSFGYNIFRNPTKIHRYFERHMEEFEHQMEAMFESFDSVFGKHVYITDYSICL